MPNEPAKEYLWGLCVLEKRNSRFSSLCDPKMIRSIVWTEEKESIPSWCGVLESEIDAEYIPRMKRWITKKCCNTLNPRVRERFSFDSLCADKKWIFSYSMLLVFCCSVPHWKSVRRKIKFSPPPKRRRREREREKKKLSDSQLLQVTQTCSCTHWVKGCLRDICSRNWLL